MTTKTSFWQLLQQTKVEIPIIQRDYAQGRDGDGYDYLRKCFLISLKKALDGQTLKLDFVYGSIENDKLQPLDGQQRLTTLWLLHWYVALHAGKKEEAFPTLAKFSYETRISSREFIQHLCNSKNFINFNPNSEHKDVVHFIKNATWYFSEWDQDPTISAMLRMIKGSDTKDKNGDDIIDGLEELFANTKTSEFEIYWKRLTETDSIIFYRQDLEDFGLSDDLYVKMNARGKQLTSFENFKADLIGHLREMYRTENDKLSWQPFLAPESGIPIKLDTTWAQMFWANHSDDYKIDDIYFAFLNRYFLNYAITKEDANEENKIWKLYGEKSNDSKVKYDSGFDIYSAVCLTPQLLKKMSNMLNSLANNSIDNKKINSNLPKWSRISFIPKYEKGTISTFSQPQRVVFYGICRYFEDFETFNNVQFQKWMRIVCNLVEKSTINTVEAMIARIKLIDELSVHIDDIYEFLAYQKAEIKSKASAEQLYEESEKAKQILDPDCSKLPEKPQALDENIDWNWEQAIIEAENYAFFKGAIRFLFLNDNNEICWKCFSTKLEWAHNIFNENGLNEEYKKSAIANRIILSYCHNWMDQIQSFTKHDKFIFGFSASIWRDNILLQKGSNDMSLLYAESIHHLLIGDGINNNLHLIDNDPWRFDALKRLVNTNILECVKSQDKNYVRWIYSGMSLYPRNCEGLILSMPARDRILNTLIDSGTIISNAQINSSPEKMLFGWNISFRYEKDGHAYNFRWQHWGYVDMYDCNTRLCEDPAKHDFTTFEVKNITDTSEFIKCLDNCIEQYEQYKLSIEQ